MGEIHGFGYLHPTARVLDPQLSVFLNERAIRIEAHSRVDGLVKIEGGNGVQIGRHVHIASFSHINAGGGMVFNGRPQRVCQPCGDLWRNAGSGVSPY